MTFLRVLTNRLNNTKTARQHGHTRSSRSHHWHYETLEHRCMLTGDGVAAIAEAGGTAECISGDELVIAAESTSLTEDATASSKSTRQERGKKASFTINDAVISEPAEGTVDLLKFTVFREGNTAITSYVDYRTVDDSATAPDDFVEILATLDPEPQKLTFLPGETSKDVFVTIKGDNDPSEGTEQFYLVLSRAENATIKRDQGIGYIRDTASDPTPMYVRSISVLENSHGTYFATEVLDANGDPVSGASVQVKLSDADGNIIRQWDGDTNESGIMTTSALKGSGRFALEPGKTYNVEIVDLYGDNYTWDQALDPGLLGDAGIDLDTDGDGFPDINFDA